MLYKKLCDFCLTDLLKDDIYFRFNGCQDEYSYCPKCGRAYYTQVRFNKIFKVEVTPNAIITSDTKPYNDRRE